MFAVSTAYSLVFEEICKLRQPLRIIYQALGPENPIPLPPSPVLDPQLDAQTLRLLNSIVARFRSAPLADSKVLAEALDGLFTPFARAYRDLYANILPFFPEDKRLTDPGFLTSSILFANHQQPDVIHLSLSHRQDALAILENRIFEVLNPSRLHLTVDQLNSGLPHPPTTPAQNLFFQGLRLVLGHIQQYSSPATFQDRFKTDQFIHDCFIFPLDHNSGIPYNAETDPVPIETEPLDDIVALMKLVEKMKTGAKNVPVVERPPPLDSQFNRWKRSIHYHRPIASSSDGIITFPQTWFPRFHTLLAPHFPKQLPLQLAMKTHAIPYGVGGCDLSYPSHEGWIQLWLSQPKHPSVLPVIHTKTYMWTGDQTEQHQHWNELLDCYQSEKMRERRHDQREQTKIGHVSILTPKGSCSMSDLLPNSSLIWHTVQVLKEKCGGHQRNPTQQDFFSRVIGLAFQVESTIDHDNLRQEIREMIEPHFTKTRYVCRDLSLGLDYLHNTECCVHLDIKGANIVLLPVNVNNQPGGPTGYTYHFIDFGHSRFPQLRSDGPNKTDSFQLQRWAREDREQAKILERRKDWRRSLGSTAKIETEIQQCLDSRTFCETKIKHYRDQQHNDYNASSNSIPIIESNSDRLNQRMMNGYLDDTQLSFSDITTPLALSVEKRPINPYTLPGPVPNRPSHQSQLCNPVPDPLTRITVTLHQFDLLLKDPMAYCDVSESNRPFRFADSPYLMIDALYITNPSIPFRKYIQLTPTELYQKYLDEYEIGDHHVDTVRLEDLEIIHRVEWLAQVRSDLLTAIMPTDIDPQSSNGLSMTDLIDSINTTTYLSLKPVVSRLNGSLQAINSPLSHSVVIEKRLDDWDNTPNDWSYTDIALRVEFYPILSPPISQSLDFAQLESPCGTKIWSSPELLTMMKDLDMMVNDPNHVPMVTSIDPFATDVYSLGLVFYTSILGFNPFLFHNTYEFNELHGYMIGMFEAVLTARDDANFNNPLDHLENLLNYQFPWPEFVDLANPSEQEYEMVFFYLARVLITQLYPRLKQLIAEMIYPIPQERIRARQILEDYGDLFNFIGPGDEVSYQHSFQQRLQELREIREERRAEEARSPDRFQQRRNAQKRRQELKDIQERQSGEGRLKAEERLKNEVARLKEEEIHLQEYKERLKNRREEARFKEELHKREERRKADNEARLREEARLKEEEHRLQVLEEQLKEEARQKQLKNEENEARLREKERLREEEHKNRRVTNEKLKQQAHEFADGVVQGWKKWRKK